jgi:tetratricopeptide (TPR) repeat protein
VVIVIVARRFSQLSVLDVDNLPEVKEEKKKDDFLRKRVEAKAEASRKTRTERLKPVQEKWKGLQKGFRKYVGHVEHTLMRERDKKRVDESPEDKHERRGELQTLLAEAAYAEIQEDYQTAEKKYIAAIRLDNKYSDAYRGLAEVYRKQGQITEAKETYQFLLQLDPNDDTIPARLGEIFAENGETEKAIQQYEQAILLNSNIPQRYLRLAELLQSLGQYQTAQEAIQQAIELEPQNPRYLDMLVEISIMVGSKDEAMQAWEDLRKVNPDNQKLDVLKEKIARLGQAE